MMKYYAVLLLCLCLLYKSLLATPPEGEPMLIKDCSFQIAGIPFRMEYAAGAGYYCSNHVFFSLDRKLLLYWKNGTVEVWETDRGKKVFSFLCPYPAEALSCDRRYAVLRDEEGKYFRMEIEKKDPISLLKPEQQTHPFLQWWIDKGGKAYPMNISGSGIIRVNLLDGKEEMIFPTSEKGCYYFQGWPAQDGENIYYAANGFQNNGETASCLFVFHTNSHNILAKRVFPHRAPYPIAWGPDKNSIYAASDSIQLLHAETLENIRSSPPLGRIFWVGLSPSQKQLYVCTNFDGLYILEPKTLEIQKHYPNIGKNANAYSLGVTFQTVEKRQIGCITTPYQSRLTIFDVDSDTIQANIQIEPACGVFLFPTEKEDKEGKCLVLPIKLPYE